MAVVGAGRCLTKDYPIRCRSPALLYSRAVLADHQRHGAVARAASSVRGSSPVPNVLHRWSCGSWTSPRACSWPMAANARSSPELMIIPGSASSPPWCCGPPAALSAQRSWPGCAPSIATSAPEAIECSHLMVIWRTSAISKRQHTYS